MPLGKVYQHPLCYQLKTRPPERLPGFFRLYSVDLPTRQASFIGDIRDSSGLILGPAASFAFGPDGQLYTTTANGRFLRVDQTTGFATFVGNLGFDARDFGGGLGFDRLRGQEGDDSLWGGRGNDRLGGAQGDDFIDAGRGHDRVLSGYGDDYVRGRRG